MTRIIVIGTSHVAALKTAWDGMAAEHPGVELDFFAAPGRAFRQFRLLGDGLVFGLPPGVPSQGAVFGGSGRTSIDLAEADYVLFAGQYWPWDELADIMSAYDIDGLREAGAPQRLSRAAFDAFCLSMARQVAPVPEWRNWTRPRFLILPAPMRSANCLHSRNQRFRPFRFLARKPQGGREVVLAFMDVFARSLAEIGVQMIPLPPGTLLPNGLTDPQYSRGSRLVFEVEGPSEDMTHMNPDFGRLQLREMLARLDLLAPAPADRAAAS